jgi:hypothetical protein
MPARYGDLNHMTDGLNVVCCVVIFCHRATAEQQETIRQALKAAALLSTKSISSINYGAGGGGTTTPSTTDPAFLRFLWACERTPFSTTLQESLRLDAPQCQQKAPLMVLLDMSHGGAFYICETKTHEDDTNLITPASILAFLQNPGPRRHI